MCRRVVRGGTGEINSESEGFWSCLLLVFGLNPIDEMELSEVFIERACHNLNCVLKESFCASMEDGLDARRLGDL